jgi:hypothetical protein
MTSSKNRIAAPAVSLLLLTLLVAGCGERWQWDDGASSDGSSASQQRAKVVLDSGFSLASPSKSPALPALALASRDDAWIVTGSGKDTFLKIHFECTRTYVTGSRGCKDTSGEGVSKLEDITVAIVDDLAGTLRTSQGAQAATSALEQAEAAKEARSGKALTALAPGEDGVTRGGFHAVVPLGGEPLVGDARVVLVRRRLQRNTSTPSSEESDASWLAFPLSVVAE